MDALRSACARLAWLIRRGRAAGLAEVFWRLRVLGRAWVEEFAYRASPTLAHRRWRCHSRPIDRDRAPLFFSEARASLVRSRAPEGAEQTIVAATDVMHGRRHLFGREITLQRPIAYSSDPRSGRRWPNRHGLLIDYRTAAAGDPKDVWEVNRLQHLPLLCAAGLLDSDERPILAAVGEAEEWIEATPPPRGIAWANGYEAGLRAISLAFLVDAARQVEGVESTTLERLVASLDVHIRFVERFPSRYSSANNHRVGELVGTIVAANSVPELPGSAERLDRALDGLRECCAVLIRGDGSNAEQAFGYDLHVADLLLVALAAVDARLGAAPQWLIDTLCSIGSFLAQAVDGDEPDPRYGDSDDAHVVLLHRLQPRSSHAVAAAIAAATADRRARRLAADVDPWALWLFGAEGGRRFDSMLPASPPGSVFLADAGLIVLREEGITATFDSGPLGYAPLFAHGHADALQVTLSVDGVEIIGDPGVGSYFGDRLVREHFRSTAAHSTILVDRESQSVSGGPFLWSADVESRIIFLDLEQRAAVARHGGYLRLHDGVEHERAVALVGRSYLVVIDHLTATELHRYSVRWAVPPDMRLAAGDDWTWVTPDETTVARCRAVASFPLAQRVWRGEEGVSGCWSRRFGALEPASLLCFDGNGASGWVVTALAVRDAAASPFALTARAIVNRLRIDVAALNISYRVDYEPGIAVQWGVVPNAEGALG